MKLTGKILLVVLGAVAIIPLLFFITYSFAPSTAISGLSSIYVPVYNLAYGNDPYINKMVKLCNVDSTEFQKVNCVYQYVQSDFEYVRESMIFKSPSNIKNDGGNCRSYTDLYCITFNKIGFRCEPIAKPFNEEGIGHVFAYVYSDELNCMIDQDIMRCW